MIGTRVSIQLKITLVLKTFPVPKRLKITEEFNEISRIKSDQKTQILQLFHSLPVKSYSTRSPKCQCCNNSFWQTFSCSSLRRKASTCEISSLWEQPWTGWATTSKCPRSGRPTLVPWRFFRPWRSRKIRLCQLQCRCKPKATGSIGPSSNRLSATSNVRLSKSAWEIARSVLSKFLSIFECLGGICSPETIWHNCWVWILEKLFYYPQSFLEVFEVLGCHIFEIEIVRDVVVRFHSSHASTDFVQFE